MTASLIALLLTAMGWVSAATPCPGGETPTTVTALIQAGADDVEEFNGKIASTYADLWLGGASGVEFAGLRFAQ
eukprot:4313233-Heterocapsa_arctica.AAC.1